MKELIKNRKEVFVKFQHTPWWNFFLAIDEQGKLQEVGWLVYPSMIFLSYQAKWYTISLKPDVLCCTYNAFPNTRILRPATSNR